MPEVTPPPKPTKTTPTPVPIPNEDEQAAKINSANDKKDDNFISQDVKKEDDEYKDEERDEDEADDNFDAFYKNAGNKGSQGNSKGKTDEVTVGMQAQPDTDSKQESQEDTEADAGMNMGTVAEYDDAHKKSAANQKTSDMPTSAPTAPTPGLG